MKSTQEIALNHLDAVTVYLGSILGREITTQEVVAFCFGIARDVIESDVADGLLEDGAAGLEKATSALSDDFASIMTGEWPLG